MLGAIRYSSNVAQLHTDESVLPRAAGARASWNYWRRRRRHDGTGVLVTYDMTRLQRPRRADRRFLVTLNGVDCVDQASVIDTMHYEHPLYTPESVAAQRRLPRDQHRRIAFAGAYHGWGFHEDGARSGVAAAAPRRRTGRGRMRTPADAVDRTRLRPRRASTRRRSIHARTTPVRHQFTHRSHTWLVDLDDLPRLGPLAARPLRVARPPRRPGRAACARTSTPSSPPRASTSRGGQILMLANARVLGYVFNPISVYWCHDARRQARAASSSRSTTPTATGTPTSSTPTSAAAPRSTRRSTSARSTTCPAATG